jgi:orotidine-5'-phosphate decarboxylase
MVEPHRLIVALDVPGAPQAEALVERLAPLGVGFKVGSQLFTAAGPDLVKGIARGGARVFLDLKFHDIPQTVRAAAGEAARLGVSMFTVHALGGAEMMRGAREGAAAGAAQAGRPRPLALAVTILTSHTEETLREALGTQQSLVSMASRLAAQAKAAALDGVVASPHEVAAIRAACGPDFTIVTPGIRLPGAPPDDQRRTMTPREALQAGADALVVGRPILEAKDPVAMVRAIIEDLPPSSAAGAPPSAL